MSGPHLSTLDTNAASTLIRGRVGAALHSLLVERDACTSVITEAQLLFGVTRRPDATRLAKAVDVFLRAIPSLPWTSATARANAELRTRLETQGICLSAMDLLIAAHAQAEDCTLVSADRAFANVSGLRVLDWSGDSMVVRDPARLVRDKLARAGIAPADVDVAVAHARAPVRRTTPKTKARKRSGPK